MLAASLVLKEYRTVYMSVFVCHISNNTFGCIRVCMYYCVTSSLVYIFMLVLVPIFGTSSRVSKGISIFVNRFLLNVNIVIVLYIY